MAEARLDEQVNELAREIAALKERLDRPESSFQRCFRVSRENWPLATFVATVLSALYVFSAYDVNYFESYANTATTKRLSEFYRKLGDRMMYSREWEAAEQSYNAALKLNPNNIDATYGVAKAQVFQPLPGQKYLPPEIVDARLQYLSSSLPDDATLYFLKAIRYSQQGDVKNSTLLLRNCIANNPAYAACYFQLGYFDHEQNRFADAVTHFETAIRLDPGFAVARNNLGFGQLILLKFEQAIEALGQAYRTSPSMVTGINLGDAYRFSGDFKSARDWHEFVLETVSQVADPADRYTGGRWTYNFMPVERGDMETIKRLIYRYTLDEKKAVAHAAVSIDLAVLGDLPRAAEHFEKSLKLDGGRNFKQFLHNKILSTINLVSLPDDAKKWLAERGKLLE